MKESGRRVAITGLGILSSVGIGKEKFWDSIKTGQSGGALAHAEKTHATFLEKGLRRISPYFNSNVIPSSCATQIGMFFGIHGDVQSVTTACASGVTAIGEAFHLIRSGRFDLAIA